VGIIHVNSMFLGMAGDATTDELILIPKSRIFNGSSFTKSDRARGRISSAELMYRGAPHWRVKSDWPCVSCNMLIKPHECTHSRRYAAAIHHLGKHATILPFRRPRISPCISPQRSFLKSPSVLDLPPSCRRFPEACLGFRPNCSSLETFCEGARIS
jgi:hypothetical protein